MRSLCVLAACIASLTSLGACSGGEVLYEPRHRFVDEGRDASQAHGAATATILDETRYVLRGYPQAELPRSWQVAVPNDSRLSLHPKLPDGFEGASRIVVQPLYRDFALGLREAFVAGPRWKSLPVTVAPVEAGPQRAFARLELDFPQALAGAQVDIAAIAYALTENPQPPHQTAEVEIPAGARLDFGIGVLEPASDRGPVAFSVEACATGDCTLVFSEVLDPADPGKRGWQDRSVALGDHAGAKRSFRFRAAPQRKEGGSFTLPVWSNPTLYAPRPRDAGEINLILLSIDTLRADHLEVYGYPLATAPFVAERFGEGGTIFENLAAASTTTTPSHMTLFTSLQPSVHRVRTGDRVLSHDAITLAEALRAQGFTTGAVTENGPLIADLGFSRGFDAYAENKSAGILLPTGQVDLTFAKARSWLKQHRNERTFLFLHTFQVHSPYAPPERYRNIFPDHPLPEGPDPQDPAHQMALYDREIRYVDDELRSLFRFLEQEGLADETLFVLTSDHGEAFLEHGFLGHGTELYSEVTHVPLMFRGAGVPRGRRVAQPVGHVDLMPTLLELMGAPPIEFAMGRSFADLLRGTAAPESRAEAPVYSETEYSLGLTYGQQTIFTAQPTYSVRVGDHKLISRWRGRRFSYQYFDLGADPGEREDRYPEMRRELRQLKALLDAYPGQASSFRNALARRGGAGEAQGTESETEASLPLDPDREEKLRALGYLE